MALAENSSPHVGILLKLCALALFITMASLIKATADDVPTGQAVFFRSFCALPVIILWLWSRGDLATGLKVQRPMAHFWRGTIGATSMAMGFASLGMLPLPEVTAIGFAAPILTVVFAALLLGERVRAFRISMVLLGLCGVLVVLWPRFSGDLTGAGAIGAALVLGSATFRALAQIQIRRMVHFEETSAIVFYFSITTTSLSLLTLPFGWVVPPAHVVLMLVMAGLVGGAGQILLTASYRHADASVLAPFDYASLLYSLLIGFFIFGESPTRAMLAGSALVILAGVLIVWRERQLGLRRKYHPSSSRIG